MRTSRVILLASCAAVAVASLLLWWTWRGEPKVMPPGPESGTNASVQASGIAPGAPQEQVADLSRTNAVHVSAAAVAEPVPQLHWFELEVVDAATQQPVADAEVFWNDAAAGQRLQQMPKAEVLAIERDPEQMARRFGRRARSDRDGRLRLAMEEPGGRVYARAGDRYGELFLKGSSPASTESYRVLLERDESLTVRVRDAWGRPAEALPIGLVVRRHGAASAGVRIAKSATTDAAGLVHFSHLQQLRPILSGTEWGNEVSAFVVQLPGHLGFVVEPAVVDASKPLPQQPIELQLPPTGSLRVRFQLGRATCPAAKAANLYVGPLGRRDLVVAERIVGGSVDADGWASFRWLPLGVPLFARPTGSLAGLLGWSGWSELPPLVDAMEQSCLVDLARDAIVLRGRLLDPAGVPLAGQEFGIDYETNEGGGVGHMSTDAEGVFACFLGTSSAAPLHLLRCSVLLPADGLSLAPPTRVLQVGVNEFGDLRFPAHPVFLAGRIDGDPVAPGTVRLVIEREEAGHGPSATEWRSLPRPPVRVDADGRFEVRAQGEPGRYRLQASASGMMPLVPIEFSVGATDLVVPMRVGYQLAASCWLPEDAPRSSVSLELVGGPGSDAHLLGGDSGRAPRGILGNSLVAPGGRIDTFWSAVDRGSYSLVVRLRGAAEPLLVIPDVAVPGPKGGDARLGSIDLRPMLQLVTLRVFDRAGRPLGDEDVHGWPRRAYVVLDPQLHEAKSVLEVLTRDARLLVPHHVPAVWFATLGFRPQWVPLTGANPIDVRLEAWPRVALRLATGTVLPEGCELVVRGVAERGPQARRGEELPGAGFTGRLFALGDLLQPAADPAVLRQPDREALLEVDQWAPEVLLRRGDRTVSMLRSVFTDWPEARTGRGVTIALDGDELAAAAAALGVAMPK